LHDRLQDCTVSHQLSMLSITPQRRLFEFTKLVDSGSRAALSRSTSTGSSTSNGQDTINPHKALEEVPAERSLYPADSLGLPDFDYPTAWSLAREHSAPLLVKNTFLGTNVQRPESLEGFFQERQIQSCPASGIALPRGKEDLAMPDEAAESSFNSNVEMTETTEADYMYMLQTPESSPLLLSAVPLGLETPPFLLHALQHMPGFHIDVQFPVMPSPLCASRCVLDLATLCPSPQPSAKRQPQFATPVSPEILLEIHLGSPQCPTLGSKAHLFGNCKPCAFLHTRGCGNGVLCSFCHLCEPGEKKRRAKDKRAGWRFSTRIARQHS